MCAFQPDQHNPLPDNKIFIFVQIKSINANKNFKGTHTVRFLFDRVENIVGKEENAGYQHFLLFQQCFQKTFFLKWCQMWSLCGEVLRPFFNGFKELHCQGNATQQNAVKNNQLTFTKTNQIFTASW